MRKTFTFNNIKKDWLYTLDELERPPFAPIFRNTISANGMDGAYLTGTNSEPLLINVPVGLKGKDIPNGMYLKEELAKWLFTEGPAPLTFDDEPDRTYFAVVQNTMEDFQEFQNFSRGTIQFLCLDPYKYGPEQSQDIQDITMVENKGTAPADPIFELTAKKKSTFAMISLGADEDSEYNLIGTPADVDEQVVDEKTLLMDELGDTVGDWMYTDDSQGSFGGDSNGVFVNSYGAGEGWHGPEAEKEIQTAQDFEAEVFSRVRTTRNEMTFRTTVHLLDENMDELAMLRVWDKSSTRIAKIVEARVGPYTGTNYENYLISDRNFNKDGKEIYYGVVRVKREGNKYTFYTSHISQRGNHFEPFSVVYHDTDNKYGGKLKYIRMGIARYGETPRINELSIQRIRVNKLEKAKVDETPYILYPDDVVTFDHKNDDLLINGEPRNDLKNFGGSFFKLKKGYNNVVVTPSDTFDAKVKFRDKFR